MLEDTMQYFSYLYFTILMYQFDMLYKGLQYVDVPYHQCVYYFVSCLSAGSKCDRIVSEVLGDLCLW